MSFGDELRKWRRRRRVPQRVLADVTHYSKGFISRVERGKRNPGPLLAELADEALNASGDLVAAWSRQYSERRTLKATAGEDEATKRRTFIKSATLATGGLAGGFGDLDQRGQAVALLRDALLPDAALRAETLGEVAFARTVTRARRDFSAGRYMDLADELARLIPVARDGNPETAEVAQIYHLTARTLIKLGGTSFAWMAADRAEQAARASGDLQAIGEARRDLASLCHRTENYGAARDIVTRTAELLRPQLTKGSSPAEWGAYGALVSTGAIAAARLEDRTGAYQMLDEAAEAARHAPRLTLSPGHVVTYRVSTSVVLGDAGAAIDHAQRIQPSKIPTAERRASYFTGIAEAYTMWGKADRAIRALLIAEKIAPEEIQRTGTRAVIQDLLHRDRHSKLSGLRALARRAGVSM